MAISRLSMKVGKAGKASPHASYIAREGRYAGRLEQGERLEATEAGNMPAWSQSNPLAFWQAADAHERVNGTTYREMELALPRELDATQRAELVREWVRNELGDRHAYQWAIHVPLAADGGEQPHAHLMFSERQVDGIDRDPEQYFKRYNSKAPERGGARKGYGPNAGKTLTKAERVSDLKELRARWEATANAHLERAGRVERIDMRSHADRGTGAEPEAKQLPSQWRGQGRENVIEFRAARAEHAAASAELRRVVPDVPGEVVSLQAALKKRAEDLMKRFLALVVKRGKAVDGYDDKRDRSLWELVPAALKRLVEQFITAPKADQVKILDTLQSDQARAKPVAQLLDKYDQAVREHTQARSPKTAKGDQVR